MNTKCMLDALHTLPGKRLNGARETVCTRVVTEKQSDGSWVLAIWIGVRRGPIEWYAEAFYEDQR